MWGCCIIAPFVYMVYPGDVGGGAQGEADRQLRRLVPVEEEGDDRGPEGGGEQAEDEAEAVDCVCILGLVRAGGVDGFG